MKYTYSFTGIVSKEVPEDQIKSMIPNKIAEQQGQFSNGSGDHDPDNIKIVEFAYISAEPNCWLVFAKWQLNNTENI